MEDELGIMIRKYRVRNNITQTEMAEMMGVTRNTIYMWENGKSRPYNSGLGRLAKVTGIPVKILIRMADDESCDQT